MCFYIISGGLEILGMSWELDFFMFKEAKGLSSNLPEKDNWLSLPFAKLSLLWYASWATLPTGLGELKGCGARPVKLLGVSWDTKFKEGALVELLSLV